MSMPKIPQQQQLIRTELIPTDDAFSGLKIVRCQSNPKDAENFANNRFQFQHEPSEYTPLKAILSRKGVLGMQRERIVATVHPDLQLFTDLVQYDPSTPPARDYRALDMIEAHEQTQSDFKGAKQKNLADFRDYLLEGLAGERTIYLPTISGWQSKAVFEKVIFVAFDEDDPSAMYGLLYLPKSPIMQSDGQTQTAALFAVAKTKEAAAEGALKNVRTTLEIELNVDRDSAGQSFADRNGRGSKKNKNLVSALDVSSALSTLRQRACRGTIFEKRLADGRSTGCTLTAVSNIVDLSTMEQILLNGITGGKRKPEHLKQYHVETFLPYAQGILKLLENVFGDKWPETTPEGQDTYRRLYVHGWAFALKAIALAYYRVRRVELEPLNDAITADEAHMTKEESFLHAISNPTSKVSPSPVSLSEFEERLRTIDWLRYRKHWTAITGISEKGGKPIPQTLKDGSVVVKAQAPNTAAVIGKVADLLVSDNWKSLCASENAPLR